MRIGIVGVSALSGAGISELINQSNALAKMDLKNEHFIFLSPSHRSLAYQLPDRFDKIFVKGLSSSSFFRTFMAQLVLPFYFWGLKIELLYCFGNLGIIFTPVKSIVVVQSASIFSRISGWSFYQKCRIQALTWLTLWSTHKARLVVYLSENSRKLLDEYLKLETKKTKVIYPAWYPHSAVPLPQVNCPRPNILTVTTIHPYKKIELLMESFNEVVKTNKYPGYLLIAGDLADKKYFAKLETIKEQLEFGERIIFLGKIEYNYIYWWYTQTDFLVFTSIEETFGIPLLEAMGAGVPIIAADTSRGRQEYFNPTREICGEAALYYNAFDKLDLSNKIMQLLEDPELYKRLKERAKAQIPRFDQQKLTQELIGMFAQIR